MRSPEQVTGHEQEPRLQHLTIFFTRHAHRTPSGELRQEGIVKAADVGAGIQSEPGHVTIASNQDRTIDTAAILEANMARPAPEEYKRLQTETGDVTVQSYMAERTMFDTTAKFGKDQQRPELYYDGLIDIKPLTKIISDATRDEWFKTHGEKDRAAVEAIVYHKGDTSGLSVEDVGRVKQIKDAVSQLRESLQHIGVNKLIEEMPESAHKLATATAWSLIDVIERAKQGKPQSKKTALIASHGGFLDSLLKETMGFQKLDEIGGHQQPVETYEIDVDFDDSGDVKNVTIPIPPERKDAPAFKGKDRVEIDWGKIKALAQEFKAAKTL